jgi:YVTN family beta-propeller protein
LVVSLFRSAGFHEETRTNNIWKEIHMKSMTHRTTIITNAATVMLGLAVIGLASCSSGDSSTSAVTSGGSAALQGPIVFVNNTGDKTLTSVALKGDSGNAMLGTIASTEFENVALGDMQFSEGEWVFMNLGAANKVATIDPLTGAQPIHEANLAAGTRPVHMYRDPTDGEVIWVGNDGDNAAGSATPGDDLINCNNPARVGGAVTGSSVTIIHNSHLGPGGNPPTVQKTECILADGHKVMAFPRPTATNGAIPRRVFVSSETAGEIAVIDNEPGSPTNWKMIGRVDLCNPAKETCNNESATLLTVPFTPNTSGPHGIRFSTLTGKVYSIQEGYGQIAEIDPTTLASTIILDLAGTPYTSFGITPNGRFLLLRGQTTAPDPQATKLGVLDLSVTPAVRTDFTIPELDGTSPGSFKFSPNGNRLYILAGNTATSTKKDRLFAFDSSTLTATTPSLTLLREIPLVATGGHNLDVLAQGAGEAKYVVVSNSTDNSISIINATDNQEKQKVTVGPTPGGIMVYEPGAAAAGNQATSSLTVSSKAKSSVSSDQLDDHGMPK